MSWSWMAMQSSANPVEPVPINAAVMGIMPRGVHAQAAATPLSSYWGMSPAEPSSSSAPQPAPAVTLAPKKPPPAARQKHAKHGNDEPAHAGGGGGENNLGTPEAATPGPGEEAISVPDPEGTPEPAPEPVPDPGPPVLVVEDEPLMLPDDTPLAHRKPTLIHTGLGRPGHRHSEDDLEAIQQKVLFSVPDEEEEKRLFGYSVTGRKAGAAALTATGRPGVPLHVAEDEAAARLGLHNLQTRVRAPKEIPGGRSTRPNPDPVQRCTVRIPILDAPPREARPAETPVPPKCKIFVDCGAASVAAGGREAEAKKEAAAALVGNDKVHEAVVVMAARKLPAPPPTPTTPATPVPVPGRRPLRGLLEALAGPLGYEVVDPSRGSWSRHSSRRSLLTATPAKGKHPPSAPHAGKKGAAPPPVGKKGGVFPPARKGVSAALDVESLKRVAQATQQQLRVANQDQRAQGFAMESSSWTQSWLRGPNAAPLRPNPAAPAPGGARHFSLAEAKRVAAAEAGSNPTPMVVLSDRDRRQRERLERQARREQGAGAASHVTAASHAPHPAKGPVPHGASQVVNVAGIGRGNGELYPEEAVPVARQVNLFSKPTQMSVTRTVMSLIKPEWHTCEQAERACGPMGHRVKLHLYKHALGTCAVVGLGKNILQKEYGPEIDGHTTVFRMGYTPLKGYEWNVGTKTTILYLRNLIRDNEPVEGTDVWRGDAYAPSKFYMYRSHAGGTRSPVGVYMGIPFTSLEGITDQRVDADLYGELLRYATLSSYADARRSDMEPSSGFRLVISLLHSQLCSRIDLYGFSLTGVGHYFRGDPAKHGQDLVMYYKHVLGLEYYVYRIAMANNLLCLHDTAVYL